METITELPGAVMVMNASGDSVAFPRLRDAARGGAQGGAAARRQLNCGSRVTMKCEVQLGLRILRANLPMTTAGP
jgi:hypothetical protein